MDGAVYAEPLVAGGKVIVATENDSVYAFDAATGHQAWRAHLGKPVSEGDLPCGNIDISGITGTPVIDATAGVVYAVTFQRFEHRLVALALATGGFAGNGRSTRQAPTHEPSSSVRPWRSRVRACTSPTAGCTVIAATTTAGCSAPPLLARPARLAYRVPTGREGAIWAPSGPALDPAGNLYVATGNGSSTSSFDFGNAVIRLTPTLHESGFFAPSNAAALSGADLDLGSTGPLLLPGSRAFIIGKTGMGYLLSTRRLGRYRSSRSPRAGICGAAFGGDAYAHGTIYVPVHGRHRRRAPRRRSTPARYGARAAAPAASDPRRSRAVGRGRWGALSARPAQRTRVRFSASIGDPAHFATPAASGGRVFVAAGGRVYAFG